MPNRASARRSWTSATSIPQREPKGKDEQCPSTGMFPNAYGFAWGGSSELGIPGARAGAATGASGYVINPSRGSVGGFASGGALIRGEHGGSGVPTQGSDSWVGGASVGFGLFGVLTNAQSAQQLSGPFTTYSLNVGLGPVSLSANLSVSGKIWELTVSPPGANVGLGASASRLRTTTVATPGCK